MNRRKFLSLIPKVAGVLGIAGMVGLSEVKKPETIKSLPSDIWGSGWSSGKTIAWQSDVIRTHLSPDSFTSP